MNLNLRYSRLWAWIQRRVFRRRPTARFVVKGGHEALLNYRAEAAHLQRAVERYSLTGEPIVISGYFQQEISDD